MAEGETKRPNVLLICVDQWGGLLTRMAGHPVVQTPTVDQLARSGVNFTRAYSATPTCIPARRGLYTGMCSRSHGDRIFNETLQMPDAPTIADIFRRNGYQAYAVGKMHVYPQRDRIGFGDVVLNEEGRHHLGMSADDWELYLAEQGYPGQEYATGVCNNDYVVHPWHLPEECHATNWTAREMCKMIRRRDPRKSSLWYMSFNCPHPPTMPPQAYLDLYRDVEIDPPVRGDWSEDFEALPYMIQWGYDRFAMSGAPREEILNARRAFYASITHVDHQIRVVIGFLREEGILDDTIIAFVSDHGDMLGDHWQWAKGVMFDMAARVPFVIVPTAAHKGLGCRREDDRLVELRDLMPTLLEMCDLPVPDTCEGMSLLGDERREYLYGEHYEGDNANRMIRDERFKLIYFPVGNHRLLFEVEQDPLEQHDLSSDPQYAADLERLTDLLVQNLYGGDERWVEDGKLVGLPDRQYEPRPNPGLTAQRGLRFL